MSILERVFTELRGCGFSWKYGNIKKTDENKRVDSRQVEYLYQVQISPQV